MTSPVVRVYRTEPQARAAVARLKELGFAEDSIHLLAPVSEEDAASARAVSRAVRAGFLLQDRADRYADHVQQGGSLVAVRAPFGSGQRAADCLDALDPIDTGLEHPTSGVSWDLAAPLSSGLRAPVLWRDQPAPFSWLVGGPLLSAGRTFESKFPELTSPDWSFSSRIGLRPLSPRQAPWSSLSGKSGPSWTRSLGMPLLSAHPTPFSARLGLGFLIGPLRLDQPAPFSAFLGVATLSRGRSLLSRLFGELASPRFALFGRSPLIRKPAPLSSLIGQPLLWEESAPLSSRIGQPLLAQDGALLSTTLTLPLLWRSPSPLSALLRLPALSRYQ